MYKKLLGPTDIKNQIEKLLKYLLLVVFFIVIGYT